MSLLKLVVAALLLSAAARGGFHRNRQGEWVPTEDEPQYEDADFLPDDDSTWPESRPQDVDPEAPQDVDPAAPQDVDPVTPQDVDPEAPQDVDPVDPAAPQDVDPVTPQDVDPVAPQDVDPVTTTEPHAMTGQGGAKGPAVWKIAVVVVVLLVSVVGSLSVAYYMCVWRGGRIHYEAQKVDYT